MADLLPEDSDAIAELIEKLADIVDQHSLTRLEYLVGDVGITLEKENALPAAGGAAATVAPVVLLSGAGAGVTGVPLASAVVGTGAGVDAAVGAGGGNDDASSAPAAAGANQPGAQAAGAGNAATSTAPTASTASDAAAADFALVKAPLVGLAYRSREPGAAPFVEVGDGVEEGTVLCLIEAMKMFNEVKADRSGTITEIHFKDTELVEFGAPLFTLRP